MKSTSDAIQTLIVDRGALPAIIAQDVGQTLVHGRRGKVIVCGSPADAHVIDAIEWILRRAPELVMCERTQQTLVVWPLMRPQGLA